MKRFLDADSVPAAAGSAAAQTFGKKTDELLEPEKAFRFSARADGGVVEVRFVIADGYYMYRNKFRRGQR